MIFTIKHPVFAILPHVWDKMTFVVGQVDDTPPKPKLVVLVNCGIAPVLSSYRFECWVPIELHLLGMHIIILSLNGALPLYNTIFAYVLHELSKAQLPMLLSLCAPALVLYCMYAYITYTRTQLR